MSVIGKTAPNFDLPSTSGARITLTELRGKRVVLFFYPKDNTPGCTREACDFRDILAVTGAINSVVLGVSSDSLASHTRFRNKYALPFDLLSDVDHAVATAYGAYGEKSIYGKKVVGTLRSTFVIDERGKIIARWSPVTVEGHAGEVIDVLQGVREASKGTFTRPAKPQPEAPKKASVKNRTMTPLANRKAGSASGKIAAARASELGRGYRQPSRNASNRTGKGEVK